MSTTMSTDKRALDGATEPTGKDTPIYDEVVAELGEPGDGSDPAVG